MRRTRLTIVSMTRGDRGFDDGCSSICVRPFLGTIAGGYPVSPSMKFVQYLASKSVRFSGESTALGICYANATTEGTSQFARRSNFWTLRA
jgi:hypothetical protein